MNNEIPPAWDQIEALPTWILSNLIYPFLPEQHLYKRYKTVPSLSSWTKYRTPLYILLDTAIWTSGLMTLVMLIAMYLKYIAK